MLRRLLAWLTSKEAALRERPPPDAAGLNAADRNPAATLSAADVQQRVAQVMALCQQAQFGEARSLCEQILGAYPDHFDALHLSGMIAGQTGDTERAIEFIARAIEVRPDDPWAHNNLGNALRAKGQYEAALQSWARAIELKPDFTEAHGNRGNALLFDAHDPQAALECFDRTLALSPELVEAYSSRALALLELERTQEALANCDQAIALRPDLPEAYYCRGVALRRLNRSREALESLDQAIRLKPDDEAAYRARGNAQLDLRQPQAALASFGQAIALQPNYAEAYRNRGLAQLHLKQAQAALESCDQAITLAPGDAEAHCTRGNALLALGQAQAALESYNHAIRLKADVAGAYGNRASALLDLDQPQAALESVEKAIAYDPRSVSAYINRGMVLRSLMQPQAAIESYDRAIELDPDCAPAHWNRAVCNLLMGNFDRGWQEYEWRWKNEDLDLPERKRTFVQPLWLGDGVLTGKTILLHSEQGLGDTLQFCRYATLVAGRGANVILEAQSPLVELLTCLAGVGSVFARREALPAFDCHCPLMSLPLAFRTTLDDIPNPRQYLDSDPAKRAEWDIALGEKRKPRVGLAWSGSATHRNDRNRSIPLRNLAELFSDEWQFVSLQQEVRPADEQALREYPGMLHFGSRLKTFADTAALCDLMDLIIAVDTGVAHLAGALGKPVWILLPFIPDWRWLLARMDSRWYPSAKLYRQNLQGDWTGVIRTLRADLRKIA